MTAVLLLGTALTLGLRHGVDWDHIAAIVDISGAGAADKKGGHPLFLCLCYALGHGAIVFFLGLLAISFAALLPSWIDSLMERVVGVTLVLLGANLLFAAYKIAVAREEVRLKSWLRSAVELVGEGIKKWRQRHLVHSHHSHKLLSGIGGGVAGGAFAVGVLHGLGAETGSQVLLVTAVGRSGVCDLSIAMLLAFIAGLIASNSVIAWLATSSFKTVFDHRSFFVSGACLAGVFSLLVGAVFCLGRADCLPAMKLF